MKMNSGFVTRKIFLKNMVSNCCIRLIEKELNDCNITVDEIKLGYVQVSYNSQETSFDKIIKILSDAGFEQITSRDKKIVEKLKLAVVELIHYMNNTDSIVRKSDYIVEKLNLNYRYLSKLFSKYEPITLERYIILNKIEKVKELIDNEEYTLSEISYMMDYSSVQYLSNQFKKETGMSVTEYKQSDHSSRKSLEELY